MRTTNTIMETAPSHILAETVMVNVKQALFTNCINMSTSYAGMFYVDMYSELRYKAPENDNYVNRR